MPNVSIVVPTFGDLSVWEPLARRAVTSAQSQTVKADVIRVHGESLCDARNRGARQAATEWLVFLDADDQLDVQYVEKMLEGDGDIRRPSTLGVVDGIEDAQPSMIPWQDMEVANCCVIGSMVRREAVLDVGGFPDFPMLEDWALFRAMWKKGAVIGDVPGAIYRIHVRRGSRNSDGELGGLIYAKIRYGT